MVKSDRYRQKRYTCLKKSGGQKNDLILKIIQIHPQLLNSNDPIETAETSILILGAIWCTPEKFAHADAIHIIQAFTQLRERFPQIGFEEYAAYTNGTPLPNGEPIPKEMRSAIDTTLGEIAKQSASQLDEQMADTMRRLGVTPETPVIPAADEPKGNGKLAPPSSAASISSGESPTIESPT